jgi:hypothetical protein
MHPADPVGQRDDGRGMGRHDQGLARVARQLQQQGQHGLAGVLVQVAGRLVGQHQ